MNKELLKNVKNVETHCISAAFSAVLSRKMYVNQQYTLLNPRGTREHC